MATRVHGAASSIELLFIDQCPHHRLTRELIIEVLREEHMEIPLIEVCVHTPEEAARHRFFGSPTVRVDGEDIEQQHGDRPFMFACRMYRHEGGLSGVPPKALIQAAVRSSR